MNENTINPFKGNAQHRIDLLSRFLEIAKQDAAARALNAVPVDQLDQARSFVLGQTFSSDLMESTFALYKALLAKGVHQVKVKTYFFSTGIDLAIRSQQAPFLIAAGTLIKKLLATGNVDRLAEFVEQILNSPKEVDLDKIVEYFKKSQVASIVPAAKLKRKIQESVRKKATHFGLEAETHAEALRAAGYDDREIPGYLVTLGYLAGLVATKIIPEAYSDS